MHEHVGAYRILHSNQNIVILGDMFQGVSLYTSSLASAHMLRLPGAATNMLLLLLSLIGVVVSSFHRCRSNHCSEDVNRTKHGNEGSTRWYMRFVIRSYIHICYAMPIIKFPTSRKCPGPRSPKVQSPRPSCTSLGSFRRLIIDFEFPSLPSSTL